MQRADLGKSRTDLIAMWAAETSAVLLIEVPLAKHVPASTGEQIPHARTGLVPVRATNSCS